MISRLNKAIKIATHSKGGIRYILSNAHSISSFNINKNIAAIVPGIATILDVGANVGQFATAANKFFPTAQIHSFEPVPDTFDILKKNTGSMSSVSVYNIAMGNSEGTIEFYQNEYSNASSALKVSEDQKAEFSRTKSYKLISVKVQKLDKFPFDKPIKKPILLKLDVQGYEKEVLMGGTEFLKEVDYLMVEVSFVRMYEGEPLFDEIHDLIKCMGFGLHGPVGLLTSREERILQMDMFYKRPKWLVNS